jgi:uncharacterized membrane protein YgcG
VLAGVLGPHAAQGILTALLVLATAACCFLIRSVPGFLRACGVVSLVILLLLPLEWPWYAALPSALLALTAAELDAVVIVLLALGSRLVAPFGDASSVGALSWTLFATMQAFIGQTVPAAIGLWATVTRAWEHRGERGAALGGGGAGGGGCGGRGGAGGGRGGRGGSAGGGGAVRRQ